MPGVGEAESGGDRRRRGLGALLAVAVAVAVALDLWLLAHRLVKMEIANAQQLELHALSRDGLIVLAENPAYYADALHHWIFHLPLLLSPRLEVAAACLNVAWYGFAWVLYRGMQARLGTVAAQVATLMFVASPVAPILSKHVISTAIVPLVMPLFVFAVLDVASAQGRPAMNRAVVLLAVLVALNHAHLVFVLPVLYVGVRWRTAPTWAGGLGALVASSTGLIEWVMLGPPVLDRLWGIRYPGPWDVVQRFVHIEGGIEEMIPVAWGLYAVTALTLLLLASARVKTPAGLWPVLAVAPLLIAADTESVISLQTPLFVAMGVVARDVVPMGWATAVYGVTYGLAAAGTMLVYADRPNVNFFSMSAAGVRQDALNTLRTDLALRAEEFETLEVAHSWDEPPYPAILPGLSYVRDRVTGPLPPGGDRCFRVDDVGRAPPPSATHVERIEADTLVFQAWRGTPCTGNPRVPLLPVVWLDLHDLSVHVGVPPTGPREGR